MNSIGLRDLINMINTRVNDQQVRMDILKLFRENEKQKETIRKRNILIKDLRKDQIEYKNIIDRRNYLIKELREKLGVSTMDAELQKNANIFLEKCIRK